MKMADNRLLSTFASGDGGGYSLVRAPASLGIVSQRRRRFSSPLARRRQAIEMSGDVRSRSCTLASRLL